MENKNPESEKANSKGTLIHDGKYIQYNVLGNIFEVYSNYIPPLQPVGRGAYGIVWWTHSSFTSIYSFFNFNFHFKLLILFYIIVAVQRTRILMKVLR